MTVFEILSAYNRELRQGIGVTIELCALVYPIGIFLGTLSGIVRHKWNIIAGIPGTIFSLILSSTPILVLLFWMHYPLQYMLQIVVDPFITSVVALSAVMMVIVSDQVKNALDEFPAQYVLSARVCGLSNRQIIRKIQLPILFRQILPHLLFAMVSILQATLFASMIGVNEIFRVAQQINSDIYRPVEIYSALALFFIGICMTLNILAFWLKSKFKWSFSEV